MRGVASQARPAGQGVHLAVPVTKLAKRGRGMKRYLISSGLERPCKVTSDIRIRIRIRWQRAARDCSMHSPPVPRPVPDGLWDCGTVGGVVITSGGWSRQANQGRKRNWGGHQKNFLSPTSYYMRMRVLYYTMEIGR